MSFLAPGQRSTRSIVGGLAHHFSAASRNRAVGYLTRVRANVDEHGTVVATVAGREARRYDARIAPGLIDAETVLAACSCPVGESLTPCKHLFAVLLFVETRDAWPASLEVPSRLAMTEIEDLELEPVGELRPIGSPGGPTTPAVVTRPTSWRARMQGTYWPRAAPATRVRPQAMEYLVSAVTLARSPTARSGLHDEPRLAVVVAAVTVTRDGTVRRTYGVTAGDGVDAADAAALDALQGVSAFADGGMWRGSYVGGLAATGAAISPGRIDDVLPRLAATERLGWVPDGERRDAPRLPLRWDPGPFELRVSLAAAERGAANARGTLVRGDEVLPLEALDAIGGAGVAIVGDRLIRIATEGVARWWRLLTGGVELPALDVPEFLEQTCQAARGPILDLDAIGWTTSDAPLAPRIVLTPRRGASTLDARAELRYGEHLVDGAGALVVHAASRRLLRRRLDEEARAARALKSSGGHLDRTWSVSYAKLRAQVATLAAAGWEVWLEGSRVRSTASLGARVSSGLDWFDVTIEVADGGAVAATPELLAALRAGRDYVRLSDGTTALLPPWLEARSRVLAAASEVDGALRFRPAEALVVATLIDELPEAQVDRAFAELRGKLDRFIGLEPRSAPRGFAATLRDYQRDGLGWLWFLRELGLGGCLADDMGLGKTVQVLALLADLRATKSAARIPSLVVAPKSLVFHWLDEARRFAPRLRTLEWHGAARANREAELAAADLVVTTYATLRRDLDRLGSQQFDLVVLDEAQAIKTATTQAARACRQLRARQRLALTGTPIENRIDDLASIFEFLNPGLLGRPAVLRAATANGDEVAAARALGRLLRPFLMRRTKSEVLAELPGKTEQIIGCRLEGKERERYDQLRNHYRAALLPTVERQGVGRSAIMVLEALLRLRQAALHPGLLDPRKTNDDSAKLDALVEHLRQSVASGHRALVFSQFTSLLAIVKARLAREAISFEYLDGGTRDRRERVAAFQGGDAAVFLLSLKAGGTGLNLTAADHVFLLDPWWNPAVEAQAIDRVHRIGQARPVAAYRLVAEDTVEAKILALQDHKRALFDGVFEERGVVSRLSVDDLRALLD